MRHGIQGLGQRIDSIGRTSQGHQSLGLGLPRGHAPAQVRRRRHQGQHIAQGSVPLASGHAQRHAIKPGLPRETFGTLVDSQIEQFAMALGVGSDRSLQPGPHRQHRAIARQALIDLQQQGGQIIDLGAGEQIGQLGHGIDRGAGKTDQQQKEDSAAKSLHGARTIAPLDVN